MNYHWTKGAGRGSTNLWDRTSPSPTSEVSTSTTNWQSGSGIWRMSAEVKQGAAGDHWKGALELVRVVSGEATEL